ERAHEHAPVRVTRRVFPVVLALIRLTCLSCGRGLIAPWPRTDHTSRPSGSALTFSACRPRCRVARTREPRRARGRRIRRVRPSRTSHFPPGAETPHRWAPRSPACDGTPIAPCTRDLFDDGGRPSTRSNVAQNRSSTIPLLDEDEGALRWRQAES